MMSGTARKRSRTTRSEARNPSSPKAGQLSGPSLQLRLADRQLPGPYRPRPGNCPALHCNNALYTARCASSPKAGQLSGPSLQQARCVEPRPRLEPQGRAIVRPFIATDHRQASQFDRFHPRPGNCPALHCNWLVAIVPVVVLPPRPGNCPALHCNCVAYPTMPTRNTPRPGNCPALHCNSGFALSILMARPAQGHAIARPFIATASRIAACTGRLSPRPCNCTALHCNPSDQSPYGTCGFPKAVQLSDPSLQR